MFDFIENNDSIRQIRETNKGHGILCEILCAVGVFLMAEILYSIPVFITGVVISVCLNMINGTATGLSETGLTILILIFQIFGIFFLFIWGEKRHNFSIRKLFFAKEKYKSKYLKFAAIGLCMILMVTGIGLLTQQYLFVGYTGKGQYGLITLLLIGFLFQGAFEEVFFRGYLLPIIARKHSVVTAIIISSLSFSVVHIFNGSFTVLSAINIFIFGLFMALYMLKYNDLWGACAIHSIWNFAQGCILGFKVSGNTALPSVFQFVNNGRDWITGGSFGPEGGIICTVMITIALIVLLKLPQKQK